MKNNFTRLTVVTLLAAGVLTGCATSNSAGVYSQGQMRQAQTVQIGTVVSVQNVKMEGNNNELLTIGGAALGGLAGSSVGGGRGQVAGAIVGALAGGVGANAAQRAMTRDALEITVKLEGSNRMISIVQDADIAITPNQRVRVLTGGGNDRVVPF
ncbi:glycine zipper 2TM domain-containing protein [Neisseriaceae bacterium TC5R-5]|nr:glycine zipper 2TM domain-containing protein [Neisseriaceae bacterium TC5R-5]